MAIAYIYPCRCPIAQHVHLLTARAGLQPIKWQTVHVFMLKIWLDSRLAWNPENYDGVKKVRIPARKLWIPDTRHYNS